MTRAVRDGTGWPDERSVAGSIADSKPDGRAGHRLSRLEDATENRGVAEGRRAGAIARGAARAKERSRGEAYGEPEARMQHSHIRPRQDSEPQRCAAPRYGRKKTATPP